MYTLLVFNTKESLKVFTISEMDIVVKKGFVLRIVLPPKQWHRKLIESLVAREDMPNRQAPE